MAIAAGEFIGCSYNAVGWIELDGSGGTEYWYVGATDHIPCSAQAFTNVATGIVSISASGVEASTRGRVIMIGNIKEMLLLPVVVGLIRNPKLTRRELLNPLNWLKK